MKLQMKKPIELKVTQEGFEKLQKELEELTLKRPGVLTRMVAAREQGDLSENAGYHAAKEQLGYIDRRTRHLKIMLRFAEVVKAKNTDVVAFGSVVKVHNGEDNVEFAIVSAMEADPIKMKVSDVSPIGKALLGKKVGEEVVIETPGGNVTYRVIEIKSI